MPGGGDAAAGGLNSLTPGVVKELPEAVREIIVGGYNDALTPVFLYMVPLSVVAAVLLCFVKEIPLATTIERDILPETLVIDGGTFVRLEDENNAPATDVDSAGATAGSDRTPTGSAPRA